MKILLFDSNEVRSRRFRAILGEQKNVIYDYEADIFSVSNFNDYDLILAHETDIESDGDLFAEKMKQYKNMLIRFSGGFSEKELIEISDKEIKINDTILENRLIQFLNEPLDYSVFKDVKLKPEEIVEIEVGISDHTKLKTDDFKRIISYLKTKNEAILFADDDLPAECLYDKSINLFNDFFTTHDYIAKYAKKIDIAILDIEFIRQKQNGISLLKELKTINSKAKVIMLSGYDNFDMAHKSYLAGADYFVSKQNFNISYFKTILDVIHIENFPVIVGKSPKMLSMYEDIAFYARFNEDVLILGENGTGKELVAKSLYQLGRKKGKFITKNCAGIPDTLFESEMFGYVKGAFTGALDKGKPSPFEESNNGVLFLDEIGDLPRGQQAKLLRVIQEKKVVALGAFEAKSFDTKLIYATNKNLAEEIEKDNFRMDFYYRISGAVINIPSLRERTEDIELLIAFFCSKFIDKNKDSFSFNKLTKLDPKSFKLLLGYRFPGNIRELEKIVYQSMLNMLKGQSNVLKLVFPSKQTLSGGNQVSGSTDVNIIALLESKQITAKGLTDIVKKRIVALLRSQHKTTKAIADIFGLNEQSFRNLEAKLNAPKNN